MGGPAIQSALQTSDESDPVIVAGRRAFPNAAGPPTLSGEMLDHFPIMPADVAGFPLRKLPAKCLTAIATVVVLSAAMREYGYSVFGENKIRSFGHIRMLIVCNIKSDEGGFKDPLKSGAGGPAIQKFVTIPVRVALASQKQAPLPEIGPQFLVASAQPVSSTPLTARQDLSIVRTGS